MMRRIGVLEERVRQYEQQGRRFMDDLPGRLRNAPTHGYNRKLHAEAAATIECLLANLDSAFTILTEAPELNMSNYDAEQVAELNNAVISALNVLIAGGAEIRRCGGCGVVNPNRLCEKCAVECVGVNHADVG